MGKIDKTVKFPKNDENDKNVRLAKYLTFVNDETGEVKGFIPLKNKSLSKGGDFMAIYQAAFDYIGNMTDLKYETLRVFIKLLSKIDFDNYLTVNQTKLAEELQMKRPAISRAIRKLQECDIIREGPRAGLNKTYRLNPAVGHKGTNYEGTVIEYEELRKKRKIDKETGEILNL